MKEKTSHIHIHYQNEMEKKLCIELYQ